MNTTTNGKKNKLIVFLSTKGGVGKSTICKATYEAHREVFPDNPPVLCDADFNVQAIAGAYPDQAHLFNLNLVKDRQRLAGFGEEFKGTGRDILIDFAGGTIDQITKLMGTGTADPSMFFELYRQAGYQPKIVVPVDFALNSNLALRNIYNAFKGCADWFIVKNLRGVPEEESYNDYFKIFEGTLPGRAQHRHLSSYVPVEFAVENMGLDLEERVKEDGSKDGTTSNSIRIPNMPIDLAIWMDDSSPFSEAALKGLPMVPYMFARSYLNDVRNRILRSDLLK
jgi:hypothetical protein